MAFTYKTLAQSKPSAATLTDVYTVPGATSAIIAHVIAANQSAVATTIRVSMAVAGAADTPKQYVAYDVPILGNTVVDLALALTMATTDVLRVYNTLATVSFNVTGVEIA